MKVQFKFVAKKRDNSSKGFFKFRNKQKKDNKNINMADPLAATSKVEQVQTSSLTRFSNPSTAQHGQAALNPPAASNPAAAVTPTAGQEGARTPNTANRAPSQRQRAPSSADDKDEGMEGWKPASRNQAIDMDTLRCKIGKGFEVQVGKRTVIEPNVTIIAEGGSIIIGVDNIISEGTWIINKSDKGEPLVIGNGNLFEPNASFVLFFFCSVQYQKKKKNDTGHVLFYFFLSGCNFNFFFFDRGYFFFIFIFCNFKKKLGHVKQGVVIGNGCVIGPRVMVIQNTRIRKDIVVFGDNMMHEHH
ncbi:hypothetical protein RFI_02941 [Reticulomyxa filosa]|uniref:Dynactin subunit 6 n=1 Tax=Reticulomyxa filosa TaxID=46433 RepID=X6P7Q9_RETFI|nr:hypothetical protein RFI_02941 [Reticulomyxa filosa]|eukprot:ETO34153.1 hypothetical protein RFI_02941 [Reticulomyxa filosa]